MVVGTVADLAFASSTSLSPTAVSPSSRIYIVWMELEPKTSAKRERVWRILMFELISKGTCANWKKFHHLEMGGWEAGMMTAVQ